MKRVCDNPECKLHGHMVEDGRDTFTYIDKEATYRHPMQTRITRINTWAYRINGEVLVHHICDTCKGAIDLIDMGQGNGTIL